MTVHTLLVDNYDSFTYNLVQLLAEVNGEEPAVLRNDDIAGWERVDLAAIDNIVISPGPGRPDRHRDFGISRQALACADVPLLGVCLGHQGLVQRYGGTVEQAPEPMHGRVSEIHHAGDPLFAGIPTPFLAVRYHSLIATHVPDALCVLATTRDGLPMALRHGRHPHWGVQFHPESIETVDGRRLLRNFRELTLSYERASHRPAGPRPGRRVPPRPHPLAPRYSLDVSRIEGPIDPERAFEVLAADGGPAAWLDSASLVEGTSRWSVLALPGPDLGEVVTADVATGEVSVTAVDGTPRSRSRESVFAYLERELRERRIADPGLPFDFAPGYVGYLGYGLKADCGADAAHTSSLPDAGLLFCDRALVIDHVDGSGWLLALTTTGTRRQVRAWTDAAAAALRGLEPCAGFVLLEEPAPLDVRWRHGAQEYLRLVAECQRLITEGESYEVCLTTMLTTAYDTDPLLTYKVLRRVNPAPHGAFLRLGFADVLSSSPERFLKIDRHGVVESKPIKGTCARAGDPHEDAVRADALRTSEKDRAENLMIVDLVRNDLGRVAETGSVHVPSLFAVESFASVHQLVSTVRARLRADASAVGCVRASFPGGSMTGAPKLRTMEIIDRLEGGPRGVYSGALGFFSLSGTVDLSIVIRTVVLSDGTAHVGAGGAIVALSDPAAELEEVRLKAAPMLRALGLAAAAGTLAGAGAGATQADRSGTGVGRGGLS